MACRGFWEKIDVIKRFFTKAFGDLFQIKRYLDRLLILRVLEYPEHFQ